MLKLPEEGDSDQEVRQVSYRELPLRPNPEAVLEALDRASEGGGVPTESVFGQFYVQTGPAVSKRLGKLLGIPPLEPTDLL
jgi:hypothetical protein